MEKEGNYERRGYPKMRRNITENETVGGGGNDDDTMIALTVSRLAALHNTLSWFQK